MKLKKYSINNNLFLYLFFLVFFHSPCCGVVENNSVQDFLSIQSAEMVFSHTWLGWLFGLPGLPCLPALGASRTCELLVALDEMHPKSDPYTSIANLDLLADMGVAIKIYYFFLRKLQRDNAKISWQNPGDMLYFNGEKESSPNGVKNYEDFHNAFINETIGWKPFIVNYLKSSNPYVYSGLTVNKLGDQFGKIIVANTWAFEAFHQWAESNENTVKVFKNTRMSPRVVIHMQEEGYFNLLERSVAGTTCFKELFDKYLSLGMPPIKKNSKAEHYHIGNKKFHEEAFAKLANIDGVRLRFMKYLEDRLGTAGKSIFKIFFNKHYGDYVRYGTGILILYGLYKSIRSAFQFITRTSKTSKNFSKF